MVLRQYVPFLFATKGRRRGQVAQYSAARIRTTTASISTFFAAALLYGAILNFYFVTSDRAKLGLIAAYKVAFALCVVLLTNAKRSEIFAACAAYAAVIVVFVSGTLGNSNSSGVGGGSSQGGIGCTDLQSQSSRTALPLSWCVLSFSWTSPLLKRLQDDQLLLPNVLSFPISTPLLTKSHFLPSCAQPPSQASNACFMHSVALRHTHCRLCVSSSYCFSHLESFGEASRRTSSGPYLSISTPLRPGLHNHAHSAQLHRQSFHVYFSAPRTPPPYSSQASPGYLRTKLTQHFVP